MSDTSLIDLSNMLSKRFIARPDVKAVQYSDGSWSPHTTTGKRDGERIPWRRTDLERHLTRSQTFGHYLLNQNNECKLFAFDIDLEKNVPPDKPHPFQGYWPEFSPDNESVVLHEFDAREAWLDRKHPSRSWQKYQLKVMSAKLMAVIHEELELPCAAAYSGGKGVHVYAFTGLISAEEAREGAQIVLDSIGEFTATRGTNFFKWKDDNPVSGFPNLSIEVFPKQNSLDGKDLGNLMRLPLGRNMKSSDPTFFIDYRTPMAEMKPAEPMWAMTTSCPWEN